MRRNKVETLKVLTFNLRIPEADGINAWKYRKSHIIDKIKKENPMIISFQEVMPDSLNDLKQGLLEYVFVGCPREADYSGEAVMIAYQKDYVDLLQLDVFWLSHSPEHPGSKYSEEMTLPRTCLMGEFRMASGKFIRIVNTHLDHLHSSLRVLGMETILKQIKHRQQIKPLPTLLMGDFNATPSEQEIQMVEQLVDVTAHIPMSFHEFKNKKLKIDYIFKTPELMVNNVIAWDDCYEGVYLSDHYPISCEVFL